jgi:hypothetical protein
MCAVLFAVRRIAGAPAEANNGKAIFDDYPRKVCTNIEPAAQPECFANLCGERAEVAFGQHLFCH